MGDPKNPEHIEDDVLEGYAMGVLSADALPALEEHLLFCAECQSRLREADDFLHLFTAAASRVDFKTVPWWRKLLDFRAHPLLIGGLAVILLSIPAIRRWNRSVSAPEAEILLQSFRGSPEGAHVIAGRPARLVFDVPSASGICKLRILDTNGVVIQEMLTAAVRMRPTASVNRLAPGDYWARLYCEGNNDLTAEYSLNAN